jgi:ABC-2 type transport system ATP-binding protein
MTTEPAQAIRVRGLEKSYPKLPVLRGVDFDVARGSIFALLGSNGAGFQLTDAGGRRVATYSGGMRRCLDIAMSLIGNPPVIFLDEPTTGLDPQSRTEVWNCVRELAGQGTTVLLTTQYLDEAEQLADRIAILHEGRIIANGTLTELKQLFPPAKVEYVEKQPSLEDIFLALVGSNDSETSAVGPEI